MIARSRFFWSPKLAVYRVHPVLRDATWITVGAVVGAVGTLFGLRLLTEVVPADVFGPFILANGMLALAGGVALQPVAQAGLRFHPDLRRRGSEEEIRHLMAAAMLRRVLLVALLIASIATVDRWLFGWLSPLAGILLAATLFVDAARTIETVMRNAGGDQLGYAALGAADAWARPMAAAALAWSWQVSVEGLLAGQLLGAIIAAAVFVRTLPRPIKGRESSVLGELRAYARPLAWTSALGWFLSLADRYILAALLGASAAGLYAAAYGLVSRPMLMLGGIAESVLRQRLYAATTSDDDRRRRRVELVWLATNVSLGIGVVVLLVLMGPWVVTIALAEDYRAGVLSLLVPLGLGHVMVLAYQAVVRRLYAFGLTRRVVLADSTAAAAAVSGAFIGATSGGVQGVAWAMPIYGAVQLGLALILAGKVR